MFKALAAILAIFSVSVSSNVAVPRQFDEIGIASHYNQPGNKTASGKMYNSSALTAAHKTLPFGTRVKVTNLVNGKSVIVTINDRGPFKAGRVIDLTPAGAKAIGFNGLVKVSLHIM